MSFLFVACQAGAEAFLKAELARFRPWLKPAYSRPGFLTFRDDSGDPIGPESDIESVFARAWGESVGKGRSPGEVVKIALETGPGEPCRLHAWVRERDDREPMAAKDAALDAAVRAEAPEGFFLEGTEARPGDAVLDVIQVGPEELWVGWHRHSPGRAPWPGGIPPLVLPPEAPSRAWLKIEEAIAKYGAPLKAGHLAVEAGSAPGGAVRALLDRGLRVIGLDTAEMDPRLAAEKRFRWVKKATRQLEPGDIETSPDWLLSDMNIRPATGVSELIRLGFKPRMGVFITLKVNDLEASHSIDLVVRMAKKDFELRSVKVSQLASNRQDVMLYGLTAMGLGLPG